MAKAKKAVKKGYKKRIYKKSSAMTINTIVKKVISKQAEKKLIKTESLAENLENAVNVSYTGTNLFELTPNASTLTLSQGTAQDDRIGNSVTTKYGQLKLQIFPNPYNATSNSIPMPQIVLCVIFSIKPGKAASLTGAQSICTTDILQNNSASSGFQGNLSDCLRDLNTDVITVHYKRTWRIGAAVYSSNTGNQANYYNYANNEFPLFLYKTINITKFLPKTVKFNDSNDDSTSRKLFCVLMPMDADGGAAVDTTAAIPLNYNRIIKYAYTDN